MLPLADRLRTYLSEIVITNNEPGSVSVSGTMRPDFAGFAGHFPGHPLLAGAFQVEMLGILALETPDSPHEISEVKIARFRKMIGPGDHLELTASIAESDEKHAVVRTIISVDGARACQATLVLEPTNR